jgi:hypothetical protein
MAAATSNRVAVALPQIQGHIKQAHVTFKAIMKYPSRVVGSSSMVAMALSPRGDKQNVELKSNLQGVDRKQ